MQVQEPQDHALGRSRGGFGTKAHLVTDGHGIVLAVWVTPGQRHESQAFATVMARAKRPRRAGRRCWPRRVGADKGYSYPGIRAWLRRRRLGGVIPTRKGQPRDESFDRAAYRRRSRVEQVVGWYKECRGPGHPLREAGRQLRRPVDDRHHRKIPAKVLKGAQNTIVRQILSRPPN